MKYETKFMKELEEVLNRNSQENNSNTPDFLLAEFLQNCLEAWDRCTKARDEWYSVNLEPANSYFKKD